MDEPTGPSQRLPPPPRLPRLPLPPWPIRLARRAYLLPVRLYQVTLSRWLGGQCRFTPTCSRYFVEAVHKRGIIRGTAKGLWRICRCHPWSKGGWDPVD